jgi:hypothetical protein
MKRNTFRVQLLAGAVATLVLPTSPLAAGNVAVEVRKAVLVLQGDAAANDVVIDRAGLGADQLRVTPENATTVNGGAAPAVFSGVTAGIKATLDAGDDEVEVVATNLPGSSPSMRARATTPSRSTRARSRPAPSSSSAPTSTWWCCRTAAGSPARST